MHVKLSAVALAAVLAGSGLAGCGGAQDASSAPSNAQVTAAVVTAAKEMNPAAHTETEDEREETASRFLVFLNQLRQVPALAPLFDRYGVPDPIVMDDDVRDAGLVDLLHAVRFSLDHGTLTIVNRVTGGVIFTAPLADLASGVFHPENLPGATTPPPPTTGGTCTSFTYSPWSACDPATSRQTRTVLTSSPAGCTGGAPLTTQACTPPLDGAALYTQSCARCHGALATSNLKGRNISVASIKQFNMTQGLTDAQLQAIVTAVGP